MYTQEEINVIALSSFPFLTQAMKNSLLNKLTSSAPDFEKEEKNLIKSLTEGVYNRVRTLFYDEEYRKGVVDSLDKKGIKCVTFLSKDYPDNFKNIPSPPILLYCKGDTSLFKSECFGIVGSRKTTAKVLLDCKQAASDLSKYFTIVTGIADGGDTAVIESVCQAKGKIISIIASGVDKIYPAGASKLFKMVEENGLLVSEYPPETLPKPYFFPIRNRLIAGLSKGVLVVSAGEKSGALITANYAKEYKKDVFAFPYAPGTPSGVGCNFLIKSGGMLTENASDVLVVYGIKVKKFDARECLDKDELALYEEILKRGEAFLPDVAKALGKNVTDVLPATTSLQIKKMIAMTGGNKYVALQK